MLVEMEVSPSSNAFQEQNRMVSRYSVDLQISGGRNFRNPSSGDFKTLFLFHASYFPRHFYFIVMDALKRCIYYFPQIRDASLFLLFALKDTWETEFACHFL